MHGSENERLANYKHMVQKKTTCKNALDGQLVAHYPGMDENLVIGLQRREI